MAASDDTPLATPAQLVEHFADDGVMEHRRLRLDASEIVGMVGEAMRKRGVTAEKLNHTRWLWVGNDDGLPTLYLIFPGLEA